MEIVVEFPLFVLSTGRRSRREIKMLFLIEKLNYFVRSILVGAIFMVIATVLWQHMSKRMKESGFIRFLYGFMLFSGAGAILIFFTAVILISLPHDMFHNNWSFFSFGWYVMAGAIVPALNIIATGIWAAGFFRCGLKIVKQNRRDQYLYQLNQPVSDPDILDRFDQAAKKAGLKRSPLLFSNIAVTVPFVKGILYPAVILPAGEFSAEEQLLIFAHELTHLKRKDVFCRYAIRMIFMIYWFLPLKNDWVKEVVELQESLCDIEVCNNYREYFSARQYFSMILSISGAESGYDRNRDSCHISRLYENTNQLQQRIGNMAGYRYGNRKCKSVLASSVGSGILLLLAMIAGTVWMDMYVLRDYGVNMSGKYDNIQWVALEEKFSGLDESNECDLRWNVLANYTLEPGMQINSESFRSAEGEKLVLMIASSEGGYEIGLRNQNEIIVIPDAKKHVSLNLELTDMETSLYIRNNGEETIELEVYCTR